MGSMQLLTESQEEIHSVKKEYKKDYNYIKKQHLHLARSSLAMAASCTRVSWRSHYRTDERTSGFRLCFWRDGH
jgi:hypothetical protein